MKSYEMKKEQKMNDIEKRISNLNDTVALLSEQGAELAKQNSLLKESAHKSTLVFLEIEKIFTGMSKDIATLDLLIAKMLETKFSKEEIKSIINQVHKIVEESFEIRELNQMLKL